MLEHGVVVRGCGWGAANVAVKSNYAMADVASPSLM